jgi:hypothetical protein
MIFSVIITILFSVFAANDIDLDTRSKSLLVISKFLPFALTILFFIAILLKSIITQKTGWTKWVCVVLGAIWLVILNLILFASPIHREIPGIWLIVILEILFLPFFILPLVIKKSYWTKWLLAAYSFFGLIISAILFFAFLDNFHGVEVETKILYRNSENKNIYIANFTKTDRYSSSYQYQVHKYFVFIKKSSFDYWKMNGRWIGYDEMGTMVSDCLYDNGSIVECKPIVPEGATLVETPEAFEDVLHKAGNNEKIAINGSLMLAGDVEVVSKNNLSLLGIINVKVPIIFSSSQKPTTITFVNCNNIKIENIQFELQAREPKTFILSFKNCKNIDIRKCKFSGESTYSLDFDKNCDSIVLADNVMENFKEYGVRVYSTSESNIDDNKYFQNDEYASSRMVWIADYQDKNILNTPFTDLYPNIEQYYFDNENSETLAIGEDIKIGQFNGSVMDLQYALGIYQTISQKLCPSIQGDCSNSINTLAFLSGINPISSQSERFPKLSFTRVNPEFVEWSSGLIKEGVIPSDFYNIVLKRFARLLCESYLYINKNENISTLIDEYADAANKEAASGFIKYRLKMLYPNTINMQVMKNRRRRGRR